MHRIDGAGHVSNMFTEGTPGIQEATVITDDWLNDNQENLCQAITGAGISLVKGVGTQLRDAIKAYIRNQPAIEGASFKVSASARSLVAEVVDTLGVLTHRVRWYSRLSSTDTNVLLELTFNCSFNGTNYVPDSSGAKCGRFSFAPGGVTFDSYTASGTTPFPSGDFVERVALNESGVSIGSVNLSSSGLTVGPVNVVSTGVELPDPVSTSIAVTNTATALSLVKGIAQISTNGAGGVTVNDGFNVIGAAIIANRVVITWADAAALNSLPRYAYDLDYTGPGAGFRFENDAGQVVIKNLSGVVQNPATTAVNFTVYMFGRQ